VVGAAAIGQVALMFMAEARRSVEAFKSYCLKPI